MRTSGRAENEQEFPGRPQDAAAQESEASCGLGPLRGGVTEGLTCIPDSENLGDNAREGTTHSVGRETTHKNNGVQGSLEP